MILRTFLTLTFVITSYIPFCQCIDRAKIACGGDWAGIPYIHRCPSYTFAFGGDTSKHWNILNNRVDIMQAPKEVLVLKQQVDNKIKDFAGDAFFSKIKFNSVEVVYPKQLKSFRDRGREDVTLKYYKAKYFFHYEFVPDTTARYHIGIALNNKGKIISPFDFPSKDNYRSIDTSFSYCKLIDIARKAQKNIDPIKEISFEFDSVNKRFYWRITQDLVDEKEGDNYFNQVFIDAADLTKVTTSKGKVNVMY